MPVEDRLLRPSYSLAAIIRLQKALEDGFPEQWAEHLGENADCRPAPQSARDDSSVAARSALEDLCRRVWEMVAARARKKRKQPARRGA